jgi:hypothetical protein
MTPKEIKNLIRDSFAELGELNGTCYLRTDLFEQIVKEEFEYLDKVDFSFYIKDYDKKSIDLEKVNKFEFENFTVIKRNQDKTLELI